jgi:hypothetical protein
MCLGIFGRKCEQEQALLAGPDELSTPATDFATTLTAVTGLHVHAYRLGLPSPAACPPSDPVHLSQIDDREKAPHPLARRPALPLQGQAEAPWFGAQQRRLIARS